MKVIQMHQDALESIRAVRDIAKVYFPISDYSIMLLTLTNG